MPTEPTPAATIVPVKPEPKVEQVTIVPVKPEPKVEQVAAAAIQPKVSTILTFDALLFLDRPISRGIKLRSITYGDVNITVDINQRSVGLTFPNPVTLVIGDLDSQGNPVKLTTYDFTSADVDNADVDNDTDTLPRLGKI